MSTDEISHTFDHTRPNEFTKLKGFEVFPRKSGETVADLMFRMANVSRVRPIAEGFQYLVSSRRFVGG